MAQVSIDVATRRIDLEEPQLTPRGTFTAVWSTDLRIEVGTVAGCGRARSTSGSSADQVADAIGDLCADDEVRDALAVVASADVPLEAWRPTWLALERRSAPGAELKALCALDEAVWDVVRTRQRLPIGRAAPPPVGVYWSGLWLHSTPDELTAEARWATAQGYDAAKVRLDGQAVGASIDRVEAVLAGAPPGRWLALELAHSGTSEGVAELVAGVDPSRILWVEDPLAAGEVAATADLVARLPVPVALGEDCWGRAALAEQVIATGAQVPIVDLGYLGGPSATQLVLEDPRLGGTQLGVHIDALTGADVAAASTHHRRVWLEAYAWWGLPPLDEVRRRAEPPGAPS